MILWPLERHSDGRRSMHICGILILIVSVFILLVLSEIHTKPVKARIGRSIDGKENVEIV